MCVGLEIQKNYILYQECPIYLFFLILLDTFGWTDTMERRTAKLRVILNPDDTRKLILPGGIPERVEQLINQVRKVCGVNCNVRLQYQDRDFGGALVNLTVLRQRLWRCASELDIYC